VTTPPLKLSRGANAMIIRGFAMTLPILLTAAIAGAVPAPPAPKKDLNILEQKLHGSWIGQGGCTGEIDFSSNGSFEWRHYGPVNATRVGKWEVRWDSLPPTLALTLKNSKIKDEVGTTIEMKITLLDDSNFGFEPEEKPSSIRFRYLRKKE
jgi:hypothetical protein